MKKDLIKVFLTTILSTYFISNYAFSESVLDKGNKIPGDDYWITSSDFSEEELKQYNINEITSSKIEKTLEDGKSKINPVRLEIIQSAALAFGAQAGLAKAGNVINKKLDSFNKDKTLDKVYNFEKVQLEPGFLPPVISEGRHAYNQPSENEVRAADIIYKIEFPARIVNAVPDWRNYLYVEIMKPEDPPKGSLPQNKDENKVWDEYVKKGWEQGYEQAIDLFESGLSRLNRDFKGMLRFNKLYQLNMVKKPAISRTELGVTGGGKEMAIGDRIIKKTKDAELNPQSHKWFD